MKRLKYALTQFLELKHEQLKQISYLYTYDLNM